MALHIQDQEADRLLREFARRRGIGLTAAVKVAVTEANANAVAKKEHRPGTLAERVQPLIDEIRVAMKKNNTSSDDIRSFIDDGWDGL